MLSRQGLWRLAVVGLLVVLGYLALPRLIDILNKQVPIRYVRVEGTFQYIAKKDIKKKIMPLVQVGYFSADLQAIRTAVMSLPWASQVQVERIWPDRIRLRIFEQKPVVRWKSDRLLSHRGEIFKPANMDSFQALPVLYAPEGQREEFLRIMQGLSVTLTDIGLYLMEFKVTDRQSWRLIMENGLVLELGRLEPLHKLTQLIKALMILGDELVSKMAYIDMRYPNGYAVRWHNNEKIEWNERLR